MERKENNTITLLLLLFCSSFVPLSRTIHYRYRRMKYYQQLTRFSIFATVILVLNQPTMSCSSTDSTNGIVTIDSSRRGSTDSSISTLTAESNRNSGSRRSSTDSNSSNLTTESNRNSRSRSRVSGISDASEDTLCTSISNIVLNDKLLSFIDLLIDLDAQFHNHSLQYAFQISPSSKSLYEGIWTLTSLLRLDTDEQTTEVLKAAKLCHMHGNRLVLHHHPFRGE